MKTKLISMLLIMSVILSCRKDQQAITVNPTLKSRDSLQSLSLAEVKDWYGKNISSAGSQKSLNAVTTSDKKTFSLSSLPFTWDKVQSFANKKGNYWLVYLGGQPTFNNLKQGYRKLAFLKNSTGHIQARILEIIPEGLYYQRKGRVTTSDFSGRVFIYDQAYHLLGGRVYSQGKQIGRIKPKVGTNANPTSTSRTGQLQTNSVESFTSCDWVDSYYFDSDGVFTVYSEMDCTTVLYQDGGGGGDGALAGYDGTGFNGGSDNYLGDGGGGGGDAASIPLPANLPGENNPKINPKSYLDCFGSVPNINMSMQVTIYVQEPFPGTTFNLGINSVGHTAIGLTKTGGGQTVTQVMGFYPDASGKAKMHAPGKLVDNSGLSYNVSITYNVDPVQFANLINYLNGDLPAYDITNFNCTGYIAAACQYAGIGIPNPNTTIGLPYPDGTQATAATPAGLGNSIQNLQGQPGVNTNGGTVSPTHGPCN